MFELLLLAFFVGVIATAPKHKGATTESIKKQRNVYFNRDLK